VPVAGDNIAFELEGPGRIIGVGNGDPSCHEPDVFFAAPSVRTTAVDGWRWKKVADTYAANLPEVSVQFDDATWDKVDVNAESGPLGPTERGVFRTRFTVSAQDLAAPGVELWFGKIDGDGAVYLNGQKIGAGGNAQAASVYAVKSLLHPGENFLAVTIANYGVAAGVNKGVMLRFVDNPPAVEWRRSVFNGLAQIIVKSTRESGALKLTARSAGLKPAVVSLQTTPAILRPVMP